MTHEKEILNFTVDLARQAGEVLLGYFGGKLTRTIKSHPEDFATEADMAAEKLIVTAIREQFPHDAIVAEESGAQEGTSGYTWIIDPLDGTRSFANGKKYFFVMIARVQGERMLLSVVYNPYRSELAQAVVGQGVMLNGERIIIPSEADLDLLHGLKLTERTRERRVQELKDIVLRQAVSRFGEEVWWTIGALKYRLPLCLETRPGQVWDHVPRLLLLQEAGLNVTNFEGKAYDWRRDKGAVAVVPTLQKEVLALLKG